MKSSSMNYKIHSLVFQFMNLKILKALRKIKLEFSFKRRKECNRSMSNTFWHRPNKFFSNMEPLQNWHKTLDYYRKDRLWMNFNSIIFTRLGLWLHLWEILLLIFFLRVSPILKCIRASRSNIILEVLLLAIQGKCPLMLWICHSIWGKMLVNKFSNGRVSLPRKIRTSQLKCP